MQIDALIHEEGGINFLKIRAFLEDVERLKSEGNAHAIQFTNEIEHILQALEKVCAKN